MGFTPVEWKERKKKAEQTMKKKTKLNEHNSTGKNRNTHRRALCKQNSLRKEWEKLICLMEQMEQVTKFC